jgi:hypothetical protein
MVLLIYVYYYCYYYSPFFLSFSFRFFTIIKIMEDMSSSHTIVFYETKHRILDSLNDCMNIWSDNHHCVVVRELTKIHEQVIKGIKFILYFICFKNLFRTSIIHYLYITFIISLANLNRTIARSVQ